MTQQERILELLKQRGKAGVFNYEFFHLQPAILRAASRVDELRKQGHDIETVKVTKGVFKYILHQLDQFEIDENGQYKFI